MKIAFVASILFLISSIMIAANPPEAVVNSFNKNFPAATKVKWGKENKTEWEAEFYLNEIKMSANYALSGALVETENEIPFKELPENILAAIKREYPDAIIKKTFKINNISKGVSYEADIVTMKNKKEVILMDDGSFIKK